MMGGGRYLEIINKLRRDMAEKKRLIDMAGGDRYLEMINKLNRDMAEEADLNENRDIEKEESEDSEDNR